MQCVATVLLLLAPIRVQVAVLLSYRSLPNSRVHASVAAIRCVAAKASLAALRSSASSFFALTSLYAPCILGDLQ